MFTHKVLSWGVMIHRHTAIFTKIVPKHGTKIVYLCTATYHIFIIQLFKNKTVNR